MLFNYIRDFDLSYLPLALRDLKPPSEIKLLFENGTRSFEAHAKSTMRSLRSLCGLRFTLRRLVRPVRALWRKG